MKNFKTLLIACATLLACNTHQVNTAAADKAAEPVHADSDSAVIKQSENSRRLFDKRSYASLYKDVIIDNDTVQLSCFFERATGMLKDLVIKTIPADTANPVFAEEFYFDDSLRSIAYVTGTADDASVTIFAAGRKVIAYNKKGDNAAINSIDSFTKETKISAIMFILDRYMSFFQNVKYSSVAPSLNSMMALTTGRDSIVARDQPGMNGKVLAVFPVDTHLFYLGSAGRADTSRQWGWYKVANEKKNIVGWISGDPLSVTVLTDENW